MIRNPYNITLTSTKKNIFTIAITVVLVIIGFVLVINEGFGQTTDLAVVQEAGADTFQYNYVLYTFNFIFGIISAVIAVAMILIRRDRLGVITGLFLLLALLFVFVIGYKQTSGGIAGISKKENLTLPMILIEKLK